MGHGPISRSSRRPGDPPCGQHPCHRREPARRPSGNKKAPRGGLLSKPWSGDRRRASLLRTVATSCPDRAGLYSNSPRCLNGLDRPADPPATARDRRARRGPSGPLRRPAAPRNAQKSPWRPGLASAAAAAAVFRRECRTGGNAAGSRSGAGPPARHAPAAAGPAPPSACSAGSSTRAGNHAWTGRPAWQVESGESWPCAQSARTGGSGRDPARYQFFGPCLTVTAPVPVAIAWQCRQYPPYFATKSLELPDA